MEVTRLFDILDHECLLKTINYSLKSLSIGIIRAK